jgi:hypothetical protein
MNELLEIISRQSQEEPVLEAVNPAASDPSSDTKTALAAEEQIRQPQKQAVLAEATNMDSKEKLSTSDTCINAWFLARLFHPQHRDELRGDSIPGPRG